MFMRRALVLSGGGAKGAYQIGVWKALRQLKIKIDIVTGTSVGALNGSLMVQGDFRKAKKLWEHMNFEFVFDKEILKQYNHCQTTLDMIHMFSNSFRTGGMEIKNLELLVKRYFRPNKFFSSKTDFGISTYNFSDLKPLKITKKEMSKKLVTDYIIASSSCFPAFQMKKIGKKKYIDGGVFDYLPINLALDMGAEEVIAVDLHALGIKEKVRKTNVAITYIEPQNDIGGFLNFNATNATRAMRYGYLDTLKTFHALDGKKYSFRLHLLSRCVKKYYASMEEQIKKIFDFREDRNTLGEAFWQFAYKRLNSLRKNNKEEAIEDILEYLASTFALSDQKIYSFSSFHRALWKEFKKTKSLSDAHVKELRKERKLINLFHRRNLIKYFYEQLEEENRNPGQNPTFYRSFIFFPKESLCAIYLYTFKRKAWWIW